MGDFMSFTLNLVSALTVGLVRHELSNFRFKAKSCRAFIGLTIHAKIIGVGRPLLPEIFGQSDRVGAKSPIFDLFSLIAPNKFLSVKNVIDRVVRHSLA